MSANVPGNPASWPATVPLVSDETPPQASSFNPSIETLADRTAFLYDQLPKLSAPIELTSNDTVTVPPGATHALYEMCGGGGGGGSGGPAAGSDRLSCGGGGGGGAVLAVGIIEVVAGETLTVEIGAGGVGAASGPMPANGGDGGDTVIKRGGTVIALARGAGGGSGGSNLNEVAWLDIDNANGGGLHYYAVAMGGPPVRGTLVAFSHSTDACAHVANAPHVGGRGRSGNGLHAFLLNERGGGSPQGFIGGVCGDTGLNASSYLGGGGGGGGGAGPYGHGANGGNGGNANNAGAGTSGSAGASAVAGSGAGGGGGGAAGASSSGSVNGGAGGNGGSGRCRLFFYRKTGS